MLPYLKISIIFIISALSSSLLYSQNIYDFIQFDQTSIDYGKRITWYRGSEQYRFQNKSNDTLYLLKAFHSSDVNSYLPKKGIPPGKFGFIEVIFQPKKKGSFQEEIKVLSNFSEELLTLQLKGSIKLFDNSLSLNCPSFNESGMLQIKQLNTTHFLDAPIKIKVYHQGKPVNNAFIYFDNQITEREKLSISGNEGIAWINLQWGQYKVKVYHEDYSPSMKHVLVDHELSEIRIELDEKQQPDQQYNDVLFNINQLTILLDRSTSMSPMNYLPIIKKGLISNLNQLRKTDNYALLTYSEKLEILKPHFQSQFKIDSIHHIKTYGNTYGFENLIKGFEYAESNYHTNKINHILIITDGEFNGSVNAQSKWLKYVQKYKKQNDIEISLILVGQRAKNKELIHSLEQNFKVSTFYVSNENDANYYLGEAIKKQCRR